MRIYRIVAGKYRICCYLRTTICCCKPPGKIMPWPCGCREWWQLARCIRCPGCRGYGSPICVKGYGICRGSRCIFPLGSQSHIRVNVYCSTISIRSSGAIFPSVKRITVARKRISIQYGSNSVLNILWIHRTWSAVCNERYCGVFRISATLIIESSVTVCVDTSTYRSSGLGCLSFICNIQWIPASCVLQCSSTDSHRSVGSYAYSRSVRVCIGDGSASYTHSSVATYCCSTRAGNGSTAYFNCCV